MIFHKRQYTIEDFITKIIENIDVPRARYVSAERSYQSVAKWLARPESIIRELNPHVYVQGSFALGTAIRPLAGDDHYDIDAVCQIEWDKSAHSQKHLKEAIGHEILGYAQSKKMEEPESARRCWTLNYADEAQFHMDVLPAVPDSRRHSALIEAAGYDVRNLGHFIESAISITDEKHPYYSIPYDDWLGSNPRGYKKWFNEQMQELLDERRQAIAMNERVTVDKVPHYRVKTPLQLSIQLLKRHRDVMYADDEDNLKPISIIITTLSAKAYNQERDFVSAFRNIINTMDQFIENRNGTYWVQNPVDPRENFADKWAEHPKRRTAFIEWLDNVKRDADATFAMTSAEEIVEHLSPLLGHQPVEAAAKTMFPSAVRALTLDVGLKNKVLRAPHKEKPVWTQRGHHKVEITSATVSKRGFRRHTFKSNGTPLPKHSTLWFRASTNTPRPFEVFWQIVNTGDEADRANGLRGGFDKGVIERGRLKRKESTEYSGSHSIECFIVKDGYCVAQSGVFIVNIQ
ncbi:nucleotidyltransferase [Magnetovibrio sp. PR-2]|uniref:nucleotidyltransferase n=1 Tax=Magnetovibrio sp. PR-2 TaxID=3120356 RepID=UPI002FCE3573